MTNPEPLRYDLGPRVEAFSTRCGGEPPFAVVLPRQTHTTRVSRIVDGSERLDDIDALTTNRTGLGIAVRTADCIPLLLFDPVHAAVAAVHAGWRGTVGRIVASTIDSMARDYGTDARDLRAVIGPGICSDCFEVGDEVYEAFRQARFPMSKIAVRRDKWHIDLPEANRLQLLYKGVPAENIQQSGLCTYARPHEFYSARRLGIGCGRVVTGIRLL